MYLHQLCANFCTKFPRSDNRDVRNCMCLRLSCVHIRIIINYYCITPEVLWSLKRVLGISLDKESSNGRNSMAPDKTDKLSVLT